MSSRCRVLIVGQTPPPYTGYSAMIERLVTGTFVHVQITHVRPALSRANQEIGRISLRKIVALLGTIVRIMRWRLRQRFDILYYAPAGPERVTMYRDLIILNCVRWMFPRLVLHFHSGGVAELYPHLSCIQRWLFRRAYYGADAAIQLSPLSPPDAIQLQARQCWYVPYGIEDVRATVQRTRSANPDRVRILFVAVLQESKGLLILLQACAQLIGQGVPLEIQIMGAFRSTAFQAQTEHLLDQVGLRPYVTFLGLQTGVAKWQAYADADIFCFPSFFESESLPVVLIEAMQFGLPVVASAWRGIPSLVRTGETGLLVPPQDVAALATGLMQLATDRSLAQAMGRRAREVYLAEYTLEHYVQGIEAVFLRIAEA